MLNNKNQNKSLSLSDFTKQFKGIKGVSLIKNNISPGRIEKDTDTLSHLEKKQSNKANEQSESKHKKPKILKKKKILPPPLLNPKKKLPSLRRIGTSS
ncbi:hypothetical protein P618_200999 [Holospora obtusa F1]|uniref:Uncharacterized protein n=1 Tax=Holospora obtusa F1 TaxID=1399147 RepID=W6TD51_HOLOB|nr:hypothetical protein [Holospora obtusa]ETZ06838.1 hypothetical protein P618_200999 [Holospora obtusa F1]